MKTTERHIALILEQSQVTAVEIVQSAKGYTLTAAGSFASSLNFDDQDVFSQPGSAQRENAFAHELRTFFQKVGIGSRAFAFGLNSRMIVVQTVPTDGSLSSTELDQHSLWELSQYTLVKNPNAFSVSALVLESNPETQVNTTVIVAVRKIFVNFLANVCRQLNGNLNIVDVDHFGAENALAFNYPELNTSRTLLVGADENSFDASVVSNGETKNIVTMEWTTENDMAQLADYAKQMTVDAVYFHGRIVSAAMVASLKQFLTIPVEIVNPFKKVALPRSLRNYSEIENRKQEYAAAVGLAMRTE
jgi:Tfp pilus assembly PilM family ATPase